MRTDQTDHELVSIPQMHPPFRRFIRPIQSTNPFKRLTTCLMPNANDCIRVALRATPQLAIPITPIPNTEIQTRGSFLGGGV